MERDDILMSNYRGIGEVVNVAAPYFLAALQPVDKIVTRIEAQLYLLPFQKNKLILRERVLSETQ